MRNAIGLLIAVVLALPASAGKLSGVTLADQVSVGSKTLVLNGLGLREATVLMVDVYVAWLCLEAQSSDTAAILDVKKEDRITVSVQGKDDVVNPGADFQRVLFSSWLGPNPPNVSLREGLLGHAPAD